ncbi:conserved hypothetical protein [Microbacterium sp. 8M]|uniref:hypothetical protein n=1 Tax=Microbacterium sp. 8M TaxID=2653153 RepID=UPI0012F10265|nr:hypothetical protein [Microbacterium sp. 8M]VXB91220.1 conserved hypothetical protein [Microbacterium sp. 8M]
MRHCSIDELRQILLSRKDLERGASGRAIERALSTGELHRVRRGWYLPGVFWRELWPESRHKALVVATWMAARGSDPVFSHESAAALLGLPLHRWVPRSAHVMLGSVDRHSARDVFRHEGELTEGDIVRVGGIRCTGLVRTAYDLGRMLPPASALAVVDAALAQVAGVPWDFDAAAEDSMRKQLEDRARRPGARGIRQARELFTLAEGRAQGPLESVTRYRLHQLGFPRPRVQVPVPGPNSTTYWMDIGLDEHRIFLECDGIGKYLDPELAGGMDPGQVVLEEKRREDWVRGSTGWGVARVGSDAVSTVGGFAAFLGAFAITPHGARRIWL